MLRYKIRKKMPELNQPDAQNHGCDMRVFTVVVCNKVCTNPNNSFITPVIICSSLTWTKSKKTKQKRDALNVHTRKD